MPVLRSKMSEATALGAALAAGLSVGFYPNKEPTERILDRGGQESVKAMIEKASSLLFLSFGLEAGGYQVFQSTTSQATRRNMQAQWKDAVKRAFDLAKFDPRNAQEENTHTYSYS